MSKEMKILTSAVPLPTAIMLLTETWAKCRSKDPNTKAGACVYDPESGGMFFGYNGFPKGIQDLEIRWRRPTKYEWVIHAEENALLKAKILGDGLKRCIMFATHKPCHKKCMPLIIQSGIKTVFYLHAHDDSKITDEMAKEAGVSLGVLSAILI